jgi:hypothetical protein
MSLANSAQVRRKGEEGMLRGKKIILAAVVMPLVLGLATVAIGATSHANNGMAAPASNRPETVITGACRPVKVNFATNDVNSSTTSTSFATIPGMSATFTIPGTVTSCVTAEYSGQAFAPGGQLINIEARLDGGTIAAPGEVQLAGDTDENANGEWSRSYAMQFVFAGVSPGTHTVTIVWRSFFGQQVSINKGTMIVQHK